jgi:hypothetical protein
VAGAGCLVALGVSAAFLVSASLIAQKRQAPLPSVDLIEIDVVVVDRDDTPVEDLAVADFRIKEDGRPVEIKTFAKVTVGDDQPRAGRTLALLLDDTGIPSHGTLSIQSIAKAFLSLARNFDELSVVRLHNRTDEAYGDMLEALHRIGEYRGGVVQFDPRESQRNALRQIAAMSRQLAVGGGHRKAIVCIGAQVICDVSDPMSAGLSSSWLAAVSMAARANVAVYAVVPGRVRFRGGGIAEATGGQTFGSTRDLRPLIASVWRDSSLHYLLGYWPGPDRRRLHSIDVSVARPNVRIRARSQRGEFTP